MRLLLVEDDESLAEHLRERLEQGGYAVDWSPSGEDAYWLGSHEAYAAVILDLGLPDLPGLDVLRRWRNNGLTLPVLILTARDAWQEKVDGFQAGADDYLTKPFHSEELLARLQALIRRASGGVPGPLICGPLSLDERTQSVWLSGQEHTLTGSEFRLLRYLMLHPGQILSKLQLAEQLYDLDSGADSNIIEVYMNRLRHKIGRERIHTQRGQGYRLDITP
jgi:DNA-binding response OmpR family regulator